MSSLRELYPRMTDAQLVELRSLVSRWHALIDSVENNDELLDVFPELQSPRSSLNQATSMSRPGVRSMMSSR